MPFIMFLLAIAAVLAGLGILRLLFVGLFGLARAFWFILPYATVAYVLYIIYCKVVGQEPGAFLKKKEESK
jgi:hypothetical protein